MMKSVLVVLSLFLFMLSSCRTQRQLLKSDNTFYEYVPEVIKYDTIDAEFYYENYIASYIFDDAIFKSGGFILADRPIDKKAYKHMYVKVNEYYPRSLKSKNIDVSFDSTSITKFREFLWRSNLSDNGYIEKTKINPFCGAYYKKYHLKLELFFVGNIEEIIPLFLSCDEMRKHKGLPYEKTKVPIYIVTRILNSKEL